MVSQKTAIALADLYASFFGRLYNSRFIQSRASNNDLADFLYRLEFSDDLRRDALSHVSPKEVKEFILGFYTGKIIQDIDEDLPPEEEEELNEALSLALAQAILNETAPHMSTATDIFRQRVSSLLSALREDGHFFYKGRLLTNQELTDKFGVFYNSETKAYVDMLNQNPESPTPSVEGFLLDVPLYKSYDLDSDSFIRIVHQLGSKEVTVDSYCLECGLPSTFKRTTPYFHYAGESIDRYLEVVLACTRITSHEMKFYFKVKDKSIMKIGQYPSVAGLGSN